MLRNIPRKLWKEIGFEMETTNDIITFIQDIPNSCHFGGDNVTANVGRSSSTTRQK
jgi:hypothetical protein